MMSNQQFACYPGWGLYNYDCTSGCMPTACPAYCTSLPPVHNKKSNCFPSPFSPFGGALEWQSNELILKDPCLRKQAGVTPIDCAITDLYYVNPTPKL